MCAVQDGFVFLSLLSIYVYDVCALLSGPDIGHSVLVQGHSVLVTRKFGNVERNSHCDVLHITPIRVAKLFLDCNGDLAIKAYDVRRPIQYAKRDHECDRLSTCAHTYTWILLDLDRLVRRTC